MQSIPFSTPRNSARGSHQKSIQFPSRSLKLSSIACALTGGILLASNTPMSGYGFVSLTLSSGQLLLTSLQA